MPPALGKRGRPEGGDGGGGGGGRTPGPAGLPAAAAEVEELNRQFLAWVEARVRGPGANPGAPLGAGCRAYLRHLAALQPSVRLDRAAPREAERGPEGVGFMPRPDPLLRSIEARRTQDPGKRNRAGSPRPRRRR